MIFKTLACQGLSLFVSQVARIVVWVLTGILTMFHDAFPMEYESTSSGDPVAHSEKHITEYLRSKQSNKWNILIFPTLTKNQRALPIALWSRVLCWSLFVGPIQFKTIKHASGYVAKKSKCSTGSCTLPSDEKKNSLEKLGVWNKKQILAKV